MNATSTMRYALHEPSAVRPKPSLFTSLTGAIATASMIGGGFVFASAGPVKQAEPIRFLVGHDWLNRQANAVGLLGPNWDGYGAEGVDHAQIKRLVALVTDWVPSRSQPGSVVPGADGSLQVEWHTEAASLGMLLEHDGAISAWVKPVNAAVEIERFGLEALELVAAAAQTYLL